MSAVSPRERMLKNIRDALISKTPQPFPNAGSSNNKLHAIGENPELTFAENWNAAGGMFIYCKDVSDFIAKLEGLRLAMQWKHVFCWDRKLQQWLVSGDFRNCRIGINLEKADAGLSFCESLIAGTGTVVSTSQEESGRKLRFLPPFHLFVAGIHQIVPDIQSSLEHISDKYGENPPSLITFATGSESKTTDSSEHGKAISSNYLFLVEDWPQ